MSTMQRKTKEWSSQERPGTGSLGSVTPQLSVSVGDLREAWSYGDVKVPFPSPFLTFILTLRSDWDLILLGVSSPTMYRGSFNG